MCHFGLQSLLLRTSGTIGWYLTLYHFGLQSLLLRTRLGFAYLSLWPTDSATREGFGIRVLGTSQSSF